MFSIKTDFEFTNILKRNLDDKHRHKRHIVSDRVHVANIMPSSCLRKQYYGRVMPAEEEEQIINDSQVRVLVRGDTGEHIITRLTNIRGSILYQNIGSVYLALSL